MTSYPILLLAALSLAGCATVIRGYQEELTVTSTPAGAKVRLSNGMSCAATPCSFHVPRRSELEVQVQKPGCTAQVIRVTNRVAGSGGVAMAGNIVLGGIVGAGVDAGTGATQELAPNPVDVTLACKHKS